MTYCMHCLLTLLMPLLCCIFNCYMYGCILMHGLCKYVHERIYVRAFAFTLYMLHLCGIPTICSEIGLHNGMRARYLAVFHMWLKCSSLPNHSGVFLLPVCSALQSYCIDMQNHVTRWTDVGSGVLSCVIKSGIRRVLCTLPFAHCLFCLLH